MPLEGKQFLTRFRNWYERFFSIQELRQSAALQWLFGGLLLYVFLTFAEWINSSKAVVEAYQSGQTVCWPFFQTCGEWFFLHDFYTDYSRGIFYMLLFGIMLAIVWRIWKKDWAGAHSLFLVLFIWKALVVFVFSYVGGPFYYYNLFLTAFLLFSPHKEFFARLALVLFYFLSATIKIDPGWIVGTYFSTLQTGLPLFPDEIIPLFTNMVIFSQIVLCWFLLSSNKTLQRSAVVFFVFFHLYSGILVSYHYPTAAIVPLLILFGPLNRVIPPPFTRRSFVGWTLILIIILFQAAGFLIPGDRRLTLEGNRYGMFMFEANHQCSIRVTSYSKENTPSAPLSRWESVPGTHCFGYFCQVATEERSEGGLRIRDELYQSNYAMYRCDPYEWWARYQPVCRSGESKRVDLTFDHSLNGGPFYRIMDSVNVCDVEYHAFDKNEWIKEPPEAGIVGYPIKNFYHY